MYWAGYVHVTIGIHRLQKENIGSPGAEIIGGCEPSNMNAENQI